MNVNYRNQPQQSRWSRGLCHGGEDVTACYITCFLYASPSAKLLKLWTKDEACTGCCSGQKFGLPEEPCSDCCVHFWCYACALCQEHAELKHGGFDPSKGWTGPPTVAPQVPPSMFK